MEDESIPDESITATSYIEDYFPWYARVNQTRSNNLGAAWCTNITSGNQTLTVSTKLWFLLSFISNFSFKSRSTVLVYSFIYWITQLGQFSTKLGSVFFVRFSKDTFLYSPAMDSQFVNKFHFEFTIGYYFYWIAFLHIIHSTLYSQHSTVTRD